MKHLINSMYLILSIQDTLVKSIHFDTDVSKVFKSCNDSMEEILAMMEEEIGKSGYVAPGSAKYNEYFNVDAVQTNNEGF